MKIPTRLKRGTCFPVTDNENQVVGTLQLQFAEYCLVWHSSDQLIDYWEKDQVTKSVGCLGVIYKNLVHVDYNCGHQDLCLQGELGDPMIKISEKLRKLSSSKSLQGLTRILLLSGHKWANNRGGWISVSWTPWSKIVPSTRPIDISLFTCCPRNSWLRRISALAYS